MLASEFDTHPEFQGLGYWDEHPDHPVGDWQSEVEADDTRLGYWDWVLVQMDQAENDDD